MNDKQDNILNNAKSILRESILSNNKIIEELSLLIIADVAVLIDNESKNTSKVDRTRVRLDNEHSRDVNIMAYIFSEYEHTALFPNDTQTSAFTKVSKILNVKPNTFSNKRDFFDSHTNSKRAGWRKELSEDMQKVLDGFRNLSKYEVIEIGKHILDKYRKNYDR